MTLKEEVAALERKRVVAALEEARGNITRAAEALGETRNALRAKLRGPLADLASVAKDLRGGSNGHPRAKPLPSEKMLRRARSAAYVLVARTVAHEAGGSAPEGWGGWGNCPIGGWFAPIRKKLMISSIYAFITRCVNSQVGQILPSYMSDKVRLYCVN